MNRYEQQNRDGIALCKAGRYTEAEQVFAKLIDVLKSQGVPLRSSQVMYWYLVAHYGGDKDRALKEFCAL